MYEYFEQVSSIDDWSELHGVTIMALMDLFPHQDEGVSKDLKAVQVRIVHHMKKKLADNLDPEKCFYPAMVKFLLVHFGLHHPNRGTVCDLVFELATHFHNELRTKFAALWKANSEFASDMLPSDVEYDSERFVLRQKRFRRNAESVELKIDPA